MICDKLRSALSLAVLSFGVPCHAQSAQSPDEGDISSYLFRGLAIYNEPSILAECTGEYEAFRIFEYAGMTPIGIIRAERKHSAPRLYIRKFESGGSSEAAAVDLDGTQWAELVDVFQSSGFWTSESEAEVWMPDSLSWIIEACYKDKFHSIKLYPERGFQMNGVVEHMVALKP